jgi:hypothetical protein
LQPQEWHLGSLVTGMADDHGITIGRLGSCLFRGRRPILTIQGEPENRASTDRADYFALGANEKSGIL